MNIARRLKVPLPATTVAQELFSTLIASGREDLDHPTVINIIEDLAKNKRVLRLI
jgi:3-hydroxyisobutyrate dehydrogenase-like beta-hydroxyacid dehydrogenase